MPNDLLIKGGYVVTMDPAIGDQPDTDVLVRKGVIVEVRGGVDTPASDIEVIEARGRLVIPGLVDTHRHVWQGAIGGFTPQITGAGYGPAVLTGSRPNTAQTTSTPELCGAPCRPWMQGSQRSPTGLTTSRRRPMPMRTCAASKSPASGAISSTVAPDRQAKIRTRPTPWTLAACATSNFSAGTNGRLRMGMALRGPCFTTPERNAADFAFARELGLPISLHVGMAGTTDATTTLQRFGLLGADVNYAHGNMLTDEEFDLIAASSGTLSITPSTDMLMQFGTYPGTGRALARSIVSGLGVDTICSAGTDLFSEMRLALAAERSRANAPALARGEQVPTVDLNRSATCFDWRRSTERGCGTLTIRSAASRQASRPISPSSTCAPHTSMGSETPWQSWRWGLDQLMSKR